MPKVLTPDQTARYERDGCLCPVTIMPEADAAVHRRRLEAAEAEHGPMHYRVKPHLIFRSAAELGRNPALLDAVEDILGPDILLWDSGYVIKESKNTGFVSWHQDLTYWGLDSDRLVTAWIALSPSLPESGCMRYLPATQKDGKREHRDVADTNNLLHRGQQVVGLDETTAVDIVLRPGQASLHHGWVLHASNPNTSDDRRIGLTVQYIAPSVRQTIKPGETATLVRGVDGYGHFAPEPECVEDFAPSAIAFQQEVERLKHEVYDNA